MLVHEHVAKVARFLGVRQRLDPVEDFELWYWTTLSACTNAYNAALHVAGVTEAGPWFCTQMPDVYETPDGTGGTTSAIRFDGDVIHVGMPPTDKPLPEAVASAATALQVLEAVRDPCVRGDLEPSAAFTERCETALRQCLGASAALVPELAEMIGR